MPPNKGRLRPAVEASVKDSEAISHLARAQAAQSLCIIPVPAESKAAFHSNPDAGIENLDFPFAPRMSHDTISDALDYEQAVTVERMWREVLPGALVDRYRCARALCGLRPQASWPCTVCGDSQLTAICWSFAVLSTLWPVSPS